MEEQNLIYENDLKEDEKITKESSTNSRPRDHQRFDEKLGAQHSENSIARTALREQHRENSKTTQYTEDTILKLIFAVCTISENIDANSQHSLQARVIAIFFNLLYHSSQAIFTSNIGE